MTTKAELLPDRTLSAVIAIILTVFALALGDAIIKGVSASFTLWQIFVLRSVAVILVLIVALNIRPWRATIWPKNFCWTLLRSMMLTLMWVTYYASLPHIKLSVAAAAYYTLPLFITIFASVFLGDKIGRIGWFAIALGFTGVLLVLQPKIEDFNWYALLPIASAMLYALAMILTRSRCRSENVLVLSLWMNLAMLTTGALLSLILIMTQINPAALADQQFLAGQWVAMGAREWLAIGVLSLAMLIGNIGAAYAYQNGAPATIATFDFAYVAFAVLWGIVIFHERPGAVSIAGMLLIVAAGIFAVRSK